MARRHRAERIAALEGRAAEVEEARAQPDPMLGLVSPRLRWRGRPSGWGCAEGWRLSR